MDDFTPAAYSDAVLSKKQRTEEDIKRLYITPALEAKWDKHKITMETQITDGKVNMSGNRPIRENPKKADYILYRSANNPIAVVEAKDNTHPPSYGMQQALQYAEMLDVPFAYSSNGDCFVERDILAGTEREFALSEFPTEEELLTRIRTQRGLTLEREKAMDVPYYTGQNVNSPRYYQQTAINRTLDAIARGQTRILLAMATGTGKTYTAFQIVWRLLKSGLKRKVLYLADRNILVDQSIQQDFAPLKGKIHKINAARDNKTTITSYQVYFALYQQLVGDDDTEHYSQLFREDFFDLVIIDECHRGSAKADSRWRCILDYFRSATHIGMTATPKETKYASNISYFGDPLYEYSLNQGIEDGFLAPFRVIKVTLNIGEGWRPLKDQRDKFGQVIPDQIYTNNDYDYNIVLEDRAREVAERITAFLKQIGPMSKTIVFCADEDAALRMRDALIQANTDMVQKYPNYVVRITGSDNVGKGFLKYFISVKGQCPVIATTSKLLSTGVDCKMVKLIVLDQMIGSMTEFKQIIGRGTRLLWNANKVHFTVMDMRNVTRLFADPDWDGPINVDEDFKENETDGITIKDPPLRGGYDPEPRTWVVTRNGCRVEVIQETVYMYDVHGKLLRCENIIDYTRKNVRGEYASLEEFVKKWSSADKKKIIRDQLRNRGIDLDALKKSQNMSDVDDFDFICHVAFDRKPLTRSERAQNVRMKDFFSKYSGDARDVLEALLDKYMDGGIYEMENLEVLKLYPFMQKGKPTKIVNFFGGEEGYRRAIRELEEAIYCEAI